MQTFRSSGPGGQNVNKRDTGVRIKHDASGAVGRSCEQRTQLANKRRAFALMARSPLFQNWARAKATNLPTIDEVVDAWMAEENLLVESE